MILEDIKWLLETDLAADTGRDFGKTSTKLTRKILKDTELSRQTLAGFSSGRYWQTQLRISSDRTHQPIRQKLEGRLWVDSGRHQVAPRDRLGSRHWERLREDITELTRKILTDTEISPDRH